MNMRLSKRVRARRLIVPVSTLLLCVTSDVMAGVTFTDIAEGDHAGIAYRRIRSQISGLFDAIKLRPVYSFNDNVNTPFRSRGAPGVAIFDYDRDGDLDVGACGASKPEDDPRRGVWDRRARAAPAQEPRLRGGWARS